MSLVLALVGFLLLRRSVRVERRRLRNGVLLLATVWFGLLAAGELLTWINPIGAVLLSVVLGLLPLSSVVLIGFLLANGVTMIRKEGRSLGNLLSLLAGLALIAVPVIGVLLVLTWQPVAIAAATFLLLGASYAGMFFLVLLVWSFAYSQLSKRVPSEGIVVLGSGLVRGKVPPLLRGRLDQAISVWRHARTQGHDPVLVPSGGQGSDEPVAEAVAMAEYLREQGVPDDRILVEDRATNTEENLRYSRALLDSAGHDEEMLVVTSNYHVMRAAFLARELGLPAQAVGAPTAAYYLPSAFLREFVAVLTRHKLMHAVVGTMILLVSVGAGLVASWL